MSRYWRRPRPFYRSVIDAAFFLIVLALVLAAMKQFGMIDLGVGSLQVVDGDSLRRGNTDNLPHWVLSVGKATFVVDDFQADKEQLFHHEMTDC